MSIDNIEVKFLTSLSDDFRLSIYILDLGWGNLEAMRCFLLRLGYPVSILTLDEYLDLGDFGNTIVIPGIGSAFDIKLIGDAKLNSLKENFKAERLVIGVCLGMHLFCRHLVEADTSGLGIFDIDITPILVDGNKKTNIGYRKIEKAASGLEEYYFCHSFGASIENTSLDLFHHCAYFNFEESMTSNYAALIMKDNYLGIQFHPEKSGLPGLDFFRGAISGYVNSNNSF
jgi:imidazole glycerol-phosphate synthase subunit HisH|tara:strand:+ start:14540 stop:15226 length:687 start_codon:yes stop_codon:yes gene_type:complete